jgi:membrane protein YdbS with pleckstrin-like domain
VLPIAFGFNLELMAHETTYGAPSTQWWISLSSAIVFGLAFSTILTLVVTPSLLDDRHPLERQQGDRLVATHEGACRSWEQARSASSQGRSCRIASLCP